MVLRQSKKCFLRTLKNIQESKKDWDIPSIVKGYFLSAHLRAMQKKIQPLKFFVLREEKFSQRVKTVAF